MEKDPDFISLHADPYMKWENTQICHDCLNHVIGGTGCDGFDDMDYVNRAKRTNKCEFYIKK